MRAFKQLKKLQINNIAYPDAQEKTIVIVYL